MSDTDSKALELVRDMRGQIKENLVDCLTNHRYSIKIGDSYGFDLINPLHPPHPDDNPFKYTSDDILRYINFVLAGMEYELTDKEQPNDPTET